VKPDKPKRRDLWKSAARSDKLFALEQYTGNGTTIAIPEKLRKYVHGCIEIAWVRGYRTAQRDAKR